MVLELTPRAAAICLLLSPATIRSSTCRSRGVSRASRDLTSSIRLRHCAALGTPGALFDSDELNDIALSSFPLRGVHDVIALCRRVVSPPPATGRAIDLRYKTIGFFPGGKRTTVQNSVLNLPFLNCRKLPFLPR